MIEDTVFHVASLRAETVETPLLDALADSEQGTITIAPEVATENLQKVVNKAIPRERLYHVFEEALKRDILNLRLYFLIGVPNETPADVTAIADMAKEMRTLPITTCKAIWEDWAHQFYHITDGTKTAYTVSMGCNGTT